MCWRQYIEGVHTQGRRFVVNYTSRGSNSHFNGGWIWRLRCCNLWCTRIIFESIHAQWEICQAQVGGWIRGYSKYMVRKCKKGTLFEDYEVSIWMHWIESPLVWLLCGYFKINNFRHQSIWPIICKKNRWWEAMYDLLVCWWQQGVPRRPKFQYNDHWVQSKIFWVFSHEKL